MFRHLHGYFISVHDGLCGRSQLRASYSNQEGSFGAGLLDSRSHKPIDKLLHDDLAGECLRDLDHRRDIELFDRRFDRPRWTRFALVQSQLRVELLELPHFSVGSPPEVAAPCVSEIELRDLLEAACCVKAGSQLVGERLVVDKAIRACRHDGAFVQVHGVERASLETGNLCGYQRCTIFEVLRTMRCPGLKLLPVSRERFSLLHVRGWSRRLAQCGAR